MTKQVVNVIWSNSDISINEKNRHKQDLCNTVSLIVHINNMNSAKQILRAPEMKMFTIIPRRRLTDSVKSTELRQQC